MARSRGIRRGAEQVVVPDESTVSSSRIRLLIDTNILLDVLLAREPWAEDAAQLLDLVGRGKVEGFVASHAITTVFYIVERERDRRVALTAVSDLLSITAVVSIGAADLHRAMTIGLKDFEDAVQAAACLQIGGQFLLTRNGKDYRGAPVATRTAGEILAFLNGGASSGPR
jgi:predicted nucleic acid-binding protein